jgi:ActR/RegA family two-component response regulator/anti-sigma regulatory factor (Ser/Thr protein kinase)
MFDALLNVSRLDAKLIEPVITPVAIAAIMERVSVGSKAEAEQNGLKFSCHAKDWVVETDAALFETIVRNLVSNALKFTQRGGVVMAARHRDGRCVIDIYDTGPGLSPEQHDRIFEEFSRTDQRAYGPNDGLGLGLSIARRYADLLGMKIELVSRRGHGSRFTIVLPSRAMLDSRLIATAEAGSQSNVQGLNVLVLDDDPLIVAALSRDLNDRNNSVFGYQYCKDAEIALNNGIAIDAAVLDYDLRGPETGLEFIARMCGQLGRHIPSIILSGGTDAATLAALAKSGRPWLTKPADPELIVATLGAILKSNKAADDIAVSRQSVEAR